MDYIRYGLIICLVAVGLFIAKQWAEFSEANQIASSVSSQPTSPSASTATTSTATNTGMDDDIPTLNYNNTAAVETDTSSDSSEEFITVHTPNLTLQISKIGGDIIYAVLPKYETSLEKDLGPFTIFEKSAKRVYFAQSGLLGPNGNDSKGRAVYRTSQDEYRFAPNQESLDVDLIQQIGDVTITKRYTFTADSYAVKVSHIIDNNSASDWVGAIYAQIKRDNSADPGATSSGLGMTPFLGFATATNDQPYEKIKFKELDEFKRISTQNTYIALVQHYFVSAWIPTADTLVDVSTKKTQSGDNLIRYTGPLETINAGQQGVIASTLYVGPKDQYSLEQLAPGLELTVDYGRLWWIAQPIFWFLTIIHNVVGNWGWSIILLTCCIKLLFFPLSAASYKSMAKMRKLTPKMQAIKENYGNDKQKQSQEMMALYQKEKVNPFGGCLPMLVQMPVFMALYWVLSESVELRHSPWLGWINDLSAMDPLFILPVIMGASMFIQQRLNPTPPDPMQAKIMQLMPIMFTVFFLFFPSGLVLYWVVNNILSIAQQTVITRRIDAAD